MREVRSTEYIANICNFRAASGDLIEDDQKMGKLDVETYAPICACDEDLTITLGTIPYGGPRRSDNLAK
jgi:hypothetical protein